MVANGLGEPHQVLGSVDVAAGRQQRRAQTELAAALERLLEHAAGAPLDGGEQPCVEPSRAQCQEVVAAVGGRPEDDVAAAIELRERVLHRAGVEPGQIAADHRHLLVLADGVGEGVAKTLAEIGAALAIHARDRRGGERRQGFAVLERVEQAQREAPAGERIEQVREQRLVEARRRGGAKMTDETRLDSTGERWLGEDEQAPISHARPFYMAVCTLLTDFGQRDWYVGALKGTLLRLAPGTLLVDLSHDIEPGDVVAAGVILAAAAPTFPSGTLHLAVVDPGVGSARRMLAARCGDGQICVAPDNGLLTPLLAEATVHGIDRPDLHLEGPGDTFHGRDRFAPVAAALLGGASLESLGPRVDDALRAGAAAPSRAADLGRIEGHVVHVDRYGNLITDVPRHWLGGELVRARVGALVVRRLATHYAELEPGVPALLVGSLGTLEIALRGESAAAATGIVRGDLVTIELARPGN